MSTFQPGRRKNRQGQKIDPEELKQEFKKGKEFDQTQRERLQNTQEKRGYMQDLETFTSTRNLDVAQSRSDRLNNGLQQNIGNKNPDMFTFLKNRDEEYNFSRFNRFAIGKGKQEMEEILKSGKLKEELQKFAEIEKQQFGRQGQNNPNQDEQQVQETGNKKTKSKKNDINF